jgi:uncharacterized protein (TIGR00251 family)
MSRISVRVIPNASKTEVVGREGSTWKIRLAAPPVDGKANDALIRFLADALDIAPSQIEILKGHSSKTKILSVPMVEEDVLERLQTTGS